MQNFTGVSSVGIGWAVSHADANEAAQPRNRVRSARAADRAREANPFAPASSFAADRASVTA